MHVARERRAVAAPEIEIVEREHLGRNASLARGRSELRAERRLAARLQSRNADQRGPARRQARHERVDKRIDGRAVVAGTRASIAAHER